MRVSWEQLNEAVHTCHLCPLREGCTHVVPGEGSLQPQLLCIGEGPGAEEDRLGRPFVGPSGALLTKMLASIGLSREDVYIANIVKCRPPRNRQPLPEEAAACLPFLRAQVALLRPRVILLLGATAARYTVSPEIRITRDRGQWVERKGVWMLPTYHPSALLRDPHLKRAAWQDLQLVQQKLLQLRDTPPENVAGGV